MTRELTTPSHWDDAWTHPPRWRLPSGLVVSTRNLLRIVGPKVRPGMRVLELGCAPGKLLAWIAVRRRAHVAGVDYSERGVAWCRRLFENLGIPGDVRCEDVFNTSFEPGTFDVVYSCGLIEHFGDPEPIVRSHVRLLKPGGMAIMAIPHYGGLYGRLQAWFDPENLAKHNTRIMDPASLVRLAPEPWTEDVRAYRAGRMSPWLINFERRWPPALAQGVRWGFSALALLQPFDVPALCPLLVLEIRRREKSEC